MSVATRRVSPTLYPTPPPSASLPSIAGPSAPSKSNARHNFTLQQSHLPSGPSRVEDDGAKRESRVSKLTAQLVAQAQPCVCPWLCNTGCDAVLGSIDLLQRHVKRHLLTHKRMYTGSQCLWEQCIHEEEYASIDELVEHIDMVHIPKLVLDKGVNRTGKSTIPFRPTIPALPEPPSHPIPSYVLSSHPVSAAVPRARDGPALRRRTSDKVYPIMPVRDLDDYWPVNGEADVHNDNYWPTSSFFPRMIPIDRSIVETKWRHIQRTGEWKKGLGIHVRKKTVCVPIFDAGEAMRKRKLESSKERVELIKRVKALGDVKGKGKAVVEHSEEALPDSVGKNEPYPVERITRASRRRATRKTGRSIGIAAIEEMIAFEARGVELGELPKDFSFAK